MNGVLPKPIIAPRTSGAKPHDPKARALKVSAAVRELERIGAAFSVADVAERAGVSRATIYRSPTLRALVGAKGDGARVVEADTHAKLAERHEAIKTKARKLRYELTQSEARWDEMRARALLAERKLADAERELSFLKSRNGYHSHAGPNASALASVSGKLGQTDRRRARRLLARALHPDLFAQDTAASALATELLKMLNTLTD